MALKPIASQYSEFEPQADSAHDQQGFAVQLTAAADTEATLAPSAPLKEAFDQLDELERLPAGWDGVDADPVSSTAIRAAGKLLAEVRQSLSERHGALISPLAVVPTPDGGVQVEWVRGLTELDVRIRPSGQISYLTATGPRGRRSRRNFPNASRVEAVAALQKVLAG